MSKQSVKNRGRGKNPRSLANLHKWKAGESGNPTGRPPNPESITNLMREVGNMVGVDGRTRKEALVEKLWEKAEKGDLRAAEYIIDRQEGRPRERHDVSTTGLIDFYTLTDEQRRARIEELSRKRLTDATDGN
jgi:hypothetical protein